MATFPVDRPGGYDPDLIWDEEGGTWSSTYASVVQGRVDYLVVIGEQGEIYFKEVA